MTVGISGQSGLHRSRIAYPRSAEASAPSAAMASPPNRWRKPNDNAAVFAYYQTHRRRDRRFRWSSKICPSKRASTCQPEFIALTKCRTCEHAKYLKLEDPPTPPKISAVRRCDRMIKIGIFGGLGGAFLFEELQGRGAVGTMTGFAYPEALVKIHQPVCSEGDVEGASAKPSTVGLPLIRYENTAGLGAIDTQAHHGETWHSRLAIGQASDTGDRRFECCRVGRHNGCDVFVHRPRNWRCCGCGVVV